MKLFSGQLLLYSLLSCIASSYASAIVRRATITTNTRNNALLASFGAIGDTTTVNQGVTYWLSGGTPHSFFGNFVANGNIVASQTDFTVLGVSPAGLVSLYTGHDTTNGNFNISSTGSVSLNDHTSLTGAAYTWNIRSFLISGSMQWCGRGDTLGSTYSLICDLDCFNNGILDWEQYNDAQGFANVWQNTVLAPANASNSGLTYNVYNNGVFRLIRVTFNAMQNVLGTGCWNVGFGATLYFNDGSGLNQNPGFGSTFPNQNIFFSSANGTVHLNPLSYSNNPNFGPQFYNFGSGNSFSFLEPIATNNGYTYNGVTGILTVNFISGNTVNLKIGSGYSATGFTRGTNVRYYGVYNAIYYSAAAAVSVAPATCTVNLQTCTNPASTAYATRAVPVTATSTISTYTTVSTVYTGSVASTTTVAQPVGTRPGTIVVFTPASYVTSTSAYTGLVTSTSTVVQATGTAPGTIVIYTPLGFVTTTSAYTGQVASTATVALPTGTSPGTVVVYTPAVYVTTTSGYAGQVTSTSTVAQPIGTAPGTVVIYTPLGYVTTTTGYTGLDTSTSTVVQPSGTAPGTVVIYTPQSYVTTTAPYTGQVTSTATVAQPSGTAPGTVVIYTPASFVTATSAYTGQVTSTATLAQPSGTAPGTVVVYTPAAYITTTTPYTGQVTSTSTIAQPSGTAPGTVVVYTPAVYVTTTSYYTGTGPPNGQRTSTIAQASGTNPGTVVVYTSATYATTSIGYTGLVASTTTIAQPSGTNPGTVAVYYPTTTPTTRPATVSTNIGPNQCFCTAV